MHTTKYLHFFKTNTSHVKLPKKFTYPFYYEPHELSVMATNQLQQYLNHQTDFVGNFSKTGKMFGVLVVKNLEKKIGFIAAFSGKLADSNQHSYFVPPVFDMLPKDGYYKTEENKLNILNAKIVALESNQNYIIAIENVSNIQKKVTLQKDRLRTEMITAKKNRKEKRIQLKQKYEGDILQQELQLLNQQSIGYKLKKRDLHLLWEQQIADAQKKLNNFKSEIEILKNQRKKQSNALQQYLFDQYQFLNSLGETKGLLDIFKKYCLTNSSCCCRRMCGSKTIAIRIFKQVKTYLHGRVLVGKSS